MALDELTSIAEAELVEALFAHGGWLSGIGTPPQTPGPIEWRLRVLPKDIGVTTGIGDIDALVISTGAPERSRAVEFKRVKATAISTSEVRLNKLGELEKIVHQANARARVGFAFVRVSVLVVADRRMQASTQTPYPGLSVEQFSRISDALPLTKLDPRVGVCLCDITQVSDERADSVGAVGSSMVRGARGADQPIQLTRAIERLFRSTAT